MIAFLHAALVYAVPEKMSTVVQSDDQAALRAIQQGAVLGVHIQNIVMELGYCGIIKVKIQRNSSVALTMASHLEYESPTTFSRASSGSQPCGFKEDFAREELLGDELGLPRYEVAERNENQ
jgi:hypothetical protein